MGSTTQTGVTFGGASVNDEVKHFYLENKTPIEKIIAIGTSRHGLNAESIKEAAKQVYQSVQDGEDIPQIRVAWKVYALAKQLKITADAEENDEIAKLRKELDWYKQKWWKRIFRSPENV